MTNTVITSAGKTGKDRAIVMGGSIAGLAASRVLSDHFHEVILVERDRFSAMGEHRRGVPQGRHTHGLLAGGLRALEGFFPGLFEEAQRAGGLGVDLTRDAYWCFEGGEYRRFASDLEGLLISRPLLEGIIRERVRCISNVHFWDGCQVQGLISSSDNRRITGIKLGAEHGGASWCWQRPAPSMPPAAARRLSGSARVPSDIGRAKRTELKSTCLMPPATFSEPPITWMELRWLRFPQLRTTNEVGYDRRARGRPVGS